MGFEFILPIVFEAIGAAVIKGVVSTLISFAVSSVFAKKPASPGAGFSQQARDQLITLRQPAAARQVIFGKTRVGGVVVFQHTTPAYVGAINQHSESATVPSELTFTIASVSPAAWRSSVSVTTWEWSRGEEDYRQTGTLTQVAGTPGAGEYSVAAGVYTFNAAQVGVRIELAYNRATEYRASGYMHMIVALAGHECEDIVDVYFDDEIVPLDGSGNATGKFAGHVYVAKHLGADDQAADATLMSDAPDKWTENHRLRGVCYVYLRLLRNPELFPGGLPNVTAVVKGLKAYDPRSATTVWTANTALLTSAYLTHTRFGLGHVYADEIDEDALIAAANVCDEDVSLAAGGTEDRYTCNGTFSTAEQPKDVLGRLKVAMAGHVVRVGGRWKIHAGAYVAPTVTLDEDDARGPIRVSSRLTRRDGFNAVKGVYVSPGNGYQPADFPVVTNATYLADDQGERQWLDIDLAFTNSPSTAQRIAKIELERVRQQITVQMPCKMTAFLEEPPNTVALSVSRFGWSGKVFQVAQLKLVNYTDSDGVPALGVDLVLRETASGVYAWDNGEETAVDVAPDTNLPNPFSVAPPGVPSIVESLYETTGSTGVRTKVVVTWGHSEDGQARRYDMQWKRAADASWNEQTGLAYARAEVLDLAAGAHVFRVRAVNGIGVASRWEQTEISLIGLSAVPANVSGFSVFAVAGIGFAQWTQHADLDVKIGGSIVVRHTPGTSGAIWNDGVIVGEFEGKSTGGYVPLMTGTYLAKARDSSGNFSDAAVAFTVTAGIVTPYTTVTTITEHSSFSGTKTDVEVVSSALQLKASGSPSVLPASGSYAFNGSFDEASAATRRVQVNVDALSFDIADLFDSSELFDSAELFDNTGDVNDCNVLVQGRFSQQALSTPPNDWTEWTPFFAAEFTYRSAQFRALFSSGSQSHNIAVSTLQVVSSVPT